MHILIEMIENTKACNMLSLAKPKLKAAKKLPSKDLPENLSCQIQVWLIFALLRKAQNPSKFLNPQTQVQSQVGVSIIIVKISLLLLPTTLLLLIKHLCKKNSIAKPQFEILI